MGAYINPPNQTKEDWLTKNATRISLDEVENFENFKEEMPVILLNNFIFTAAGIGFNKEETSCFIEPDDDRPKIYYKAKVKDLLEVSNLKNYMEHL